MSLGEIAKAFYNRESYIKKIWIAIVQFEYDECKWDFRPHSDKDDIVQ
jgi:hypothetical protein